MRKSVSKPHKSAARSRKSDAGSRRSGPKSVKPDTKLSATAARLEECEARYKELFRNAGDAIIVMDKQGRFVDLNPAACRIFNIPKEKLLKLSGSDFVPSYSRERYKALLDGTLRPPVLRGEYTAHGPGDRKVTLDVVGVRLGKDHVMFIARDVTRYRVLCEEIETERRRLYDVLDRMNDPVILIGPHHRVEFLNRKASKTFGECKGKLCHVSIMGSRRPCQNCELHLVLAGKMEKVNCEIEDKTGRWREVTMSAMESSDGSLGAIVVMRDISERKETETRLKTSEEMFRSLIRHAGLGIAYLDLDGVHLDVNDAFCQMTGFSREELIGTGLPYQYWSEVDFPSHVEAMQPVLRGEMISRETVFQRKNGDTFPVKIHAAPVKNHSGEPIGVVGIMEDISEWATLQQQLIYAHKMEQAGAIAGGIAHEFNNLHGGIQGYIELVLADRGLPKHLRNDLDVVLRTLRGASSITNQLLTFARRMPPRKELCKLHDVVENALKLAKRELETLQIEVDVHHAKRIPELMMDGTQIGQVLLNLFINARDAMVDRRMPRDQSRRLLIETGTLEGKVFIRVGDQGCGIAPENLGRIFEPFFTTKEPLDGMEIRASGLGLSVSDTIVREHGGRMEVSSTPGRGSVFTIWLPVETTGPPRVLFSRSPRGVRAKGSRVLVIDDEEVMRSLVQRALVRAGCRVASASSCTDGLAQLKKNVYDVAIMDLQMTDACGMNVLRTISKMKSMNRPATIVITGPLTPGKLRGLRRFSVVDVLQKPVTLDSLYASLEKAHGKKQR